jgi:hypothetical protein
MNNSVDVATASSLATTFLFDSFSTYTVKTNFSQGGHYMGIREKTQSIKPTTYTTKSFGFFF